MSHFVYKLISPRPTFPFDMTEAEGAAMRDHAAYWTELLGEGHAVAFGPVMDPAGVWGLAVVEAEDEAAVRGYGSADPAVVAGVCTFDVLAMGPTVVRPHAPV